MKLQATANGLSINIKPSDSQGEIVVSPLVLAQICKRVMDLSGTSDACPGYSLGATIDFLRRQQGLPWQYMFDRPEDTLGS